MNCSLPSMETALVEKLQRTYMLAAMWKKEKWLKVERSIGEHRVLEAGLEVKYLIMERCRDGTLQQQNTTALAAMIPVTVF